MPDATPFLAKKYRPTSDKPLPHSKEAERAVLGAIKIDNTAIRVALEYVKAADFFLPENQKLFRHMIEMHEAQTPIDNVTLYETLTAAGDLESCGGVGYVSSLGDDLPRVNNVAHYAKIILEKARLRLLAYYGQWINERVEDPASSSMELMHAISSAMRNVMAGGGEQLVTAALSDFLVMDLPPREYVIEPLLTARGRGMIYAFRGVGKTFFCMELAHSMACGHQAFVWPVAKKRPVKYIEGEMDGTELQERFRHLCMKVHEGQIPEDRDLVLIAKDLPGQKIRPKINTTEGRAQLDSVLNPGDVLILDNLTALSPSSDEQESEDWAQIQEWMIDLSWNGISVIAVHHSGWNTAHSRGGSKREDLLDFVLSLRLPGDYREEEGLRAEIKLEKKRGYKATAGTAAWAAPFEVKLEHDCWTTRPLAKIMRERAREMLQAGMHPRDVVLETGMSRFAVHRLAKEVKNNMTSIDLDNQSHPPTPF